jgi:hypothetical protein
MSENSENFICEDYGTYEEFDEIYGFEENYEENLINEDNIYTENKNKEFINNNHEEEESNKIDCIIPGIDIFDNVKEKKDKQINQFQKYEKILDANFENKNENISSYISPLERKKRKMMKELKKKQKLNNKLIKKNIQNRIKENNLLHQNNTLIKEKSFFYPIFHLNCIQEKSCFLGKKRILYK